MAFAGYAERWIGEHKLRPRTRELYSGLLKNHIRPHLGRLTLDKISTPTIRTWRKKLLDGGASETTVAKAYRLVRAVLNTAVGDELIRANPCRIKGADREPTPERPVATVDQVFRLADLMPTRYRALVLFAAFVGLRWGEIIALRRCDLDLEAQTVRVHRSFVQMSNGEIIIGPPKSAAGTRTVALPGLLMPELRRHLEKLARRRR